MIEDQLKTIDKKVCGGHPVDIFSYSETIRLGKLAGSNIDAESPTPKDTAIIMYTSGTTGKSRVGDIRI